ncbi:MAG: hypothetical protein ACOC4M_08130 [Promethearchaeia archaeon]
MRLKESEFHRKVLEAISSLPRNDCDVNTICIYLNSNYNNYSPLDEYNILKKRVKKALDDLIDAEKVRKIAKKLPIGTADGWFETEIKIYQKTNFGEEAL